MADIELMIKIPEEYYERMKNTSFWWSGTKNCILKGIVIPKGHGDLIDRSALVPDSNYEDGLFYAVSIGAINSAQTIVKADRSDEE